MSLFIIIHYYSLLFIIIMFEPISKIKYFINIYIIFV
jgi:hypothetical protein